MTSTRLIFRAQV